MDGTHTPLFLFPLKTKENKRKVRTKVVFVWHSDRLLCSSHSSRGGSKVNKKLFITIFSF